jgi:ferritin-like metal-binding protein YciE
MLLENLSDLLQRGLEYAWDSEHILVKLGPKMAAAATSEELKHAFDLHVIETKGHIYRIEQIFTRLERSPAAEKNEPVRILAGECERMIRHIERSALLDAALAFCGNQIEQCETGLYEPLVGFALTLGLEEIAGLLDEILGQERETGHGLIRLAESSINRAASDVQNPRAFTLL